MNLLKLKHSDVPRRRRQRKTLETNWAVFHVIFNVSLDGHLKISPFHMLPFDEISQELNSGKLSDLMNSASRILTRLTQRLSSRRYSSTNSEGKKVSQTDSEDFRQWPIRVAVLLTRLL